ncbi:TetR/AcrR family transcriptional regulator [Nocardioides antri]|uniref:TetR/AcrR family transcriptional regulator n=1 Tax=Nocardioides antri TaxID=2607659 RepID=A0A5B1M695_9ACTN|nr:TetR/AcrR family transcriptional regulator [Nocardioides antri]KAA1428321.1 TetR/AcrR family transcriptional regulator [Nocardioides antri]
MTTTRTGPAGAGRQLRADARKNIAAIIDAATDCLARDPDASISEIAKAAGVGRVTLYGHFDSRATLVAAVVDRAMAEAESVLGAVDLDGDPVDALRRLVAATWEVSARYGALVVAAERTLADDEMVAAHAGLRDRAVGFLERGRAAGHFRDDLPVQWQVTLLHTVTHAAATAVHNGELTAEDAPLAITTAVLGATTPPGAPVPDA